MSRLSRIVGITGAALVVSVVGCTRVQQSSDRQPLAQSGIKRAAAPDRTIYRHSVILGGVSSRSELKSAASQDPVVADHYRSVRMDDLQAEHSPKSFSAYVSYRKKGQVYWTRHKVKIPRGELVLVAGGEPAVRARCGNRISSTPQLPVLPSTHEPLADELDQIETDSSDTALVADITSKDSTSHLASPEDSHGDRELHETVSASSLAEESSPSNWGRGATGVGGGGWAMVPFNRGQESPSSPTGAEPVTSESITEWASLPSYSADLFYQAPGPPELLKSTAAELVAPPGTVRAGQPAGGTNIDSVSPVAGSILTPGDLVVGSVISEPGEEDPAPGPGIVFPTEPGPAGGTELLPPDPEPGADPIVIPEPTSLLLVTSGLSVVFLALRRQRRVTTPVGVRPTR